MKLVTKLVSSLSFNDDTVVFLVSNKFVRCVADAVNVPNGKILETGTSNIIFIKDNKYYSPIRKFYRGVNLKFFEKHFKNHNHKKTMVFSTSGSS